MSLRVDVLARRAMRERAAFEPCLERPRAQAEPREPRRDELTKSPDERLVNHRGRRGTVLGERGDVVRILGRLLAPQLEVQVRHRQEPRTDRRALLVPEPREVRPAEPPML